MVSPEIKRNLLTDQVVEQLEELLFEGGLGPESSLPSEAELVERFGVSRAVIREAVRTLEARGLIKVRQGKRPTINGLNAMMPSIFFRTALRRDNDALLELIEVRFALEVRAALLAATRATAEDVKAMQETIDVMKEKVDVPGESDDADTEFHQRLAVASGNRFLQVLVEALKDPLRASRTASRRGRELRGRDVTGYVIAAHQKILDRVAAKDPEGAAEAMELHLKEALEDLRAASRSSNLEGDEIV